MSTGWKTSAKTAPKIYTKCDYGLANQNISLRCNAEYEARVYMCKLHGMCSAITVVSISCTPSYAATSLLWTRMSTHPTDPFTFLHFIHCQPTDMSTNVVVPKPIQLLTRNAMIQCQQLFKKMRSQLHCCRKFGGIFHVSTKHYNS